MALRFWPWQKLLRPGPILVNAPAMALSFALRLPSQFATNAITRCLKTYMHTGASVLSATPLHDYVPRKADKGECMQKATKESSTGTHRSARALLIAPLTSQSSYISVIHNEAFQAKALKGLSREARPAMWYSACASRLWMDLVSDPSRSYRAPLLPLLTPGFSARQRDHPLPCPPTSNRRALVDFGWGAASTSGAPAQHPLSKAPQWGTFPGIWMAAGGLTL